MEKDGLFKNRKIVPRWRKFENTKKSELISSKNLDKRLLNTDDLLNFYYLKWQKNSTIENASEVIDAAIWCENKSLAYGAAEQLLKSEDVLPAVKRAARIIRHGFEIDENNTLSEDPQLTKLKICKEIKLLREKTKEQPRNAFVWLEMARLNSWIGNNKNAQLDINRAYGAAPENRFVLRALARFYAHIVEPEEAISRILKSESIKHDPWIQAAEIALSGLIDRTPRSIKYARDNLNRKHLLPLHTSELASALGTEELMAGKRKVAKNLFAHSLISPTDNSVAQAIWANSSDKINIHVNKEQLLIDKAFEARANVCLENDNYNDAINHCALWSRDEPFSIVPAMEGSHIALAFLEDYKAAIQFVNQGLFANPNSFGLWNNGAVAYAKSGDLEKSKIYFSNIINRIRQEIPEPNALATQGLIFFRSGDWDKGRVYYEKSVLESIKQKQPETAFRAKYHWLYEEVYAGINNIELITTLTKALDKEAKKYSKLLSHTTIKHWDKTQKDIENIIKDYDAKGTSLFSSDIMLREISDGR